MKILHVLYQSLPQVSGSSIRSRDIMLSQQEIGLNVIAITAPFQNSTNQNAVYDSIDGIKYIRTSKEERQLNFRPKEIYLSKNSAVFFNLSIYNFIIQNCKNRKTNNHSCARDVLLCNPIDNYGATI